MFTEICHKIKFWKSADRLGPDIPYTHWRLHFKSTMLKICKKKFKYFADTAEFRAGAYALACSRISIGENVIIRPGTNLSTEVADNAEIVIEDFVMMGPGIHIYTNNHRFDDVSKPIFFQGDRPSQKVVIKRGSWIGANAIILPGVTVGENAVVGANSVVTKNVPPMVVVAGNPAKIIKVLKENANSI